jgi:hypothetical protein
MNPIATLGESKIRDFSLGQAKLLRESYDRNQGNGEAVFQIDSLVIRFFRERGQDFIDLGSIDAPTQFYYVDDVFVAMGWESIDQVINREAPLSLDNILQQIRDKLNELKTVFSDAKAASTKIKFTEKLRGKKFVEKLSNISKKSNFDKEK